MTQAPKERFTLRVGAQRLPLWSDESTIAATTEQALKVFLPEDSDRKTVRRYRWVVMGRFGLAHTLAPQKHKPYIKRSHASAEEFVRHTPERRETLKHIFQWMGETLAIDGLSGEEAPDNSEAEMDILGRHGELFDHLDAAVPNARPRSRIDRIHRTVSAVAILNFADTDKEADAIRQHFDLAA